MQEIELKFQVPGDRRRAVDAAVAGVERPRRVRLQAAYVDTPGRALARAGIALRVRREGRLWVQTLKGAAADGMTRLEHNVALGASAEPPVADPVLHAGTEIGERLAKTLAAEGHGALTVLYRTDILRRTRLLATPWGEVELAFDDGQIVAGNATLPVCELEIELKSGSPLAVTQTAQDWLPRFGLWLDTRSKAERGDLLARGQAMAPARRARAIELHKSMAGDAAWQAVLRSCADQVIANASQVASGLHTDEHVHQLRVGLRRLRSALKLFRSDAPALVALGLAASTLFRALGTSRDEAVIDGEFSAELAAALRQAGIAEGPPPSAATSSGPAPGSIVREPATQALLLDLLAAMIVPAEAAAEPASIASSDGGTTDAKAAGPRLRGVLATRLNRWHRQAAADAKRFTELETEARHTLRKRIKRLRYAVEFCGSLFDRKDSGALALRRYLKPMRVLQERLGALNDGVMAMQAFRERRDTDPRAWFALGWLAARQERLLADAQPELKAFAKVKPFWKA
ncbi:CYTH and CHAD domain-containing protein [soil metagenome]